MTTPVPHLAQPLTLGPVTLRNRFVSAPMERNYCEIDGTMTDRYIDYLERRAAGGAALVFTEASYVRADGKGRYRQMGADVDERIPGITRLADAIHRHGALLGVELNHGGRTAAAKVSGFTPVAPSAIPCVFGGNDMPEVLDTDDIHYLIECYGEAAARCQQAGVDVISLHGGHGYLIHQFLSPAYNKRTDEFADPVLFVNLVIDAVRRAAPEVALGIRLSAFEGIPDGLDAEATLDRVARMHTDKLDFLDISAGNYEAGQWIIQPGEWERGLLAPYAQPYHRFGLPVGVAGRINRPEVAERIVAEGQAEFVSMARTLHADPDFPNRALAGERFRPCIACNYCIDNLGTGEPIPCSVNPWVARERRQTDAVIGNPIRATVIGGGPAGLAAARELAEHGHSVDLYEARGYLGGDFALASQLHEYPEYHHIVDWYLAEIERLGVRVHLDHLITEEWLADRDTDAIVLATGGTGFPVPLPGAQTREVLDVREWLAAGRTPPKAIAFFGADREAAAVADQLALAGTDVVIVGPQETIAHDVGRRAKIVLLPRLAASGNVRAYLSSTVREVEAERLLVRSDEGEQWIDAPGPLLISQGIEPRNELLAACRALEPRLGVHAIGDAGRDGGSIHAAIATGTDAALDISARSAELADTAVVTA